MNFLVKNIKMIESLFHIHVFSIIFAFNVFTIRILDDFIHGDCLNIFLIFLIVVSISALLVKLRKGYSLRNNIITFILMFFSLIFYYGQVFYIMEFIYNQFDKTLYRDTFLPNFDLLIVQAMQILAVLVSLFMVMPNPQNSRKIRM